MLSDLKFSFLAMAAPKPEELEEIEALLFARGENARPASTTSAIAGAERRIRVFASAQTLNSDVTHRALESIALSPLLIRSTPPAGVTNLRLKRVPMADGETLGDLKPDSPATDQEALVWSLLEWRARRASRQEIECVLHLSRRFPVARTATPTDEQAITAAFADGVGLASLPPWLVHLTCTSLCAANFEIQFEHFDAWCGLIYEMFPTPQAAVRRHVTRWYLVRAFFERIGVVEEAPPVDAASLARAEAFLGGGATLMSDPKFATMVVYEFVSNFCPAGEASSLEWDSPTVCGVGPTWAFMPYGAAWLGAPALNMILRSGETVDANAYRIAIQVATLLWTIGLSSQAPAATRIHACTDPASIPFARGLYYVTLYDMLASHTSEAVHAGRRWHGDRAPLILRVGPDRWLMRFGIGDVGLAHIQSAVGVNTAQPSSPAPPRWELHRSIASVAVAFHRAVTSAFRGTLDAANTSWRNVAWDS